MEDIMSISFPAFSVLPSPLPVLHLLLCLLCLEMTARMLSLLWASSRIDDYSSFVDVASNYFDWKIVSAFVLTSVFAGMYQISVKRSVNVPTLDGNNQQLLGFITSSVLYICWRFSKYNMTDVQRRELCHNKLGFGMAKGFFSYLERALQDNRKDVELQEFIDKDLSRSSSSRIGSTVTLILFPDLTSYLQEPAILNRRRNFGDNVVGLVTGIIQAERKAGSKQLEEVDALEYDYEDQSKTKRTSHYVIFSTGSQDGDRTVHKYFLAADNRPLLTLQKWYDENEDVTESELDLQQRSYRKRLEHLLLESDVPREDYAILEFKKGELLKKLEGFTKGRGGYEGA